MSRNQQFSITVTLRKVATGHKVTAFAMDDMNQAYSIAKILISSQAYSHCYAVGTSWNGDTLFNVQPEQPQVAPYQMPQAAPQLPYYPQQQAYPQQHQYPQPQYPQNGYYQQQPQYPALPHYQQPQQPQQPFYPPPTHQPQRMVVEAEVIEDNRPALPRGSR
jgi:hypothetical protein